MKDITKPNAPVCLAGFVSSKNWREREKKNTDDVSQLPHTMRERWRNKME